MVAGQHPEAILPFVVNNVVNVTNGAFAECVSHIPMSASISGCINVNFIAARIVEVFSPENMVAWGGGKVQGAGAAKQSVRHAKFVLSRLQSHDGAGHGRNQMSRRQSHKRMETVTDKTRRQPRQ